MNYGWRDNINRCRENGLFNSSIPTDMPTEISELFINASKNKGYLTLGERRIDGAKRFERRVLGYFRRQRVLQIEDLVKVLYETGVAESERDAKGIIPFLPGQRICVDQEDPTAHLKFAEVINVNGDVAYRLSLNYTNWVELLRYKLRKL